MPLIQYSHKKLSAAKLRVIEQANEIIAEYEAQGYDLTLRQLYYQFVARDLIPNNQSEYKRLGDVISDGRRAGLIDWERIVDRTRNLRSSPTWDNPAEIVGACAAQFAVDLWADQPYRPEVWVEKDALVGVLETACTPLQVPYFSCRGYTSDSEVWSAGRRLRSWRVHHQQTPVIIHLGDHDPSGIDMSRDIGDRLALFSGGGIEVRRIALNMDQIEQYEPPPNPAKTTDARFDGYQAIHGDESWELDALDPATIGALIRGEVESLIEQDAWDAATDRQDRHREQLRIVADRWDEITESL
jgi:hypothetical protein